MLDSLPADQKRLAKEQLSLLKGLSHPHLCRITEVTDSNGCLSVACEFLGENLNTCLRSQTRTWSPEELALHFLGFVAALGKTQAMVGTIQGLAHGRLSLEALHLDYAGNKMKIVGFGGFSGDPEDSTQACSRLLSQYHSPEIRQRVHFNAYKADMWALGICFLQLGTSNFLTGQETIEQVAQQAASLGPQLGGLLQLVFTGERDRPDFLQFKELSGYCQRCWNNIDIGEPLCGTCPNRSKIPLPIRPAESDQIGRPQGVQRIYRQIVRESPEPPKCMHCQRPLTKFNEKDTCRLCLSNPNQRPVPVPEPQKPIQPFVQQISQPEAQPQPPAKQFPQSDDKNPPKMAPRPLPQKSENPKPPFLPPKSGFQAEKKNQSSFPIQSGGFVPEKSSQRGGMRQEEEGGQSLCLGCHRPLPRVPRSRPGYEGYNELCEKCAAKQLEYEQLLEKSTLG